VITLGTRRIGPGERTFLIAEIGSNHNRDPEMARQLIEAAAEAGWDAVKFQLFKAEWLYPSNCGVVATPVGPVDFFATLRDAELSPDWIPELQRSASSCGLTFLCTPFDEAAVQALDARDVPALKIASPELNHLPLLRAAARTRRPLLCSTGISTLADIEEALQTIRAVEPAAQIALLQCVTAYPTPEDQSNLAVIETLRRAFGVSVGYSDHTMDPDVVPAVAVAAGACLIEKHVTLRRDLKGPDHAFAIEPAEMRRLARAVRELDEIAPGERLPTVARRAGEARVRAILGHGRKEIMPCEAELYPCDKRSIHALRDLAAGTILDDGAIRIVRSERNLTPGLHPRHWDEVLGARLNRAVARGQGLRWEHLLQR
jgi:sialic acid synthase SpsE